MKIAPIIAFDMDLFIHQPKGQTVRENSMSLPTRIMFIDDNPDEIILAEEAFAGAGWNVNLEAVYSEEGTYKALGKHRIDGTSPDLIILDLVLDSQPAFPLLKMIRSFPGFQNQPIIIFSNAMPKKEVINSCYSLQVLKVIEKPSSFSETVELLMGIKNEFLCKDQSGLEASRDFQSEANIAIPGKAIIGSKKAVM